MATDLGMAFAVAFAINLDTKVLHPFEGTTGPHLSSTAVAAAAD